MVEIKFGDRIDIEDWTEIFNIQPDMLENFMAKNMVLKPKNVLHIVN